MSNNNESRGDSDRSSIVNDDLEPIPVVDNTIDITSSQDISK